MENKKIRAEAKSAGVKMWEIAEFFGVSESTLVRWMRRELPEIKQKEYFDAIAAIEQQKKERGEL